jgi:hypothetical protein
MRARCPVRPMRRPLGFALSGAVVVMVARAALRRARTRAGKPVSGPDGEGGGTSAPSDAAPAVREMDPRAAHTSEAAGPGPADDPGHPRTKRGAMRTMVVLVVLLVGAGVAVPLAVPRTAAGRPHSAPRPAGGPSQLSGRRSGDARRSTALPRPEAVTSVVPASGSTGVAPDTTIAVTFSDPPAPGSPDPSLSPAVAGTWQAVGPSELLFSPEASFVPSTTYTVTVPGGSSGVRARSGSVLAQPVTSSFTTAPGSVLRLQQLLAKLGYLPLIFSGPTPVPAGMAIAQPGGFVWRDRGFPEAYTSQWSPTRVTAITQGAIMAFETQNGLEVDGTVGSAFWRALLADVAAGKRDTEPVTYVLVTMTLPEHLTVWVNGVLTFAHVPCNTGVPGAATTVGTYQVFEHVEVSNMRGTDVTGTSYDVTVPWASYFHGGQALHGYPRASYGFPQSNGCVEMPISTAGRVWPDTPIGTLVTVV